MHNRFVAVFNIIAGYGRHRKSRFRPLDSTAIPPGIKRFVVMSNPMYIGTYASRSSDYNIPLDDLTFASHIDFYRNNVKIAVLNVVRSAAKKCQLLQTVVYNVAFSSAIIFRSEENRFGIFFSNVIGLF